ncbi:MAG: hypothetical protein M3Z36_06635 [Acidobacteriota bacterium]|nr:hypothetical protein [Acidobacteriota bacterium]
MATIVALGHANDGGVLPLVGDARSAMSFLRADIKDVVLKGMVTLDLSDLQTVRSHGGSSLLEAVRRALQLAGSAWPAMGDPARVLAHQLVEHAVDVLHLHGLPPLELWQLQELAALVRAGRHCADEYQARVPIIAVELRPNWDDVFLPDAPDPDIWMGDVAMPLADLERFTHPRVAVTYPNLAGLCLSTGDPDAALARLHDHTGGKFGLLDVAERLVLHVPKSSTGSAALAHLLKFIRPDLDPEQTCRQKPPRTRMRDRLDPQAEMFTGHQPKGQANLKKPVQSRRGRPRRNVAFGHGIVVS